MTVGITELSLRELAAAIGTSHRMLIYHFGSREGLLTAVTREVEARERAALQRSLEEAEDPRERWSHLTDPKLWPQERLFFELYAQALLGRSGTEGFLDGIVDAWLPPISEAFVAAGADQGTARADARLTVAVVRGLLLDLLATKDQVAVDEAFDRFVQLIRPLS